MCTIHTARVSGLRLPVFSVGKFWQEVEYTFLGRGTRMKRHGLSERGGGSIFAFVTETLNIFLELYHPKLSFDIIRIIYFGFREIRTKKT